MNSIIAVPTVEQINIEHQLANSKANEAVQHATNCGLMLLQVKASKAHGEWLPWLNGEIESGRLKVGERQARRYMQVASNRTREANLVEAPSIRAALELLSDKEPEEQPGTLIDVEAERKAREDAEAEVNDQKRRTEEWRQQALQSRKEVFALQHELKAIQSAEKPKPEIKFPDDYETLKETERELRNTLADVRQQQAKFVDEQVRAKLRGYQDELNEVEKKKAAIEEIVDRKKAYLDSLSSEVKRIETHRSVIDGSRLELIGLAAFLNDMEPMNDKDTIRRWLALADMHEEAMKTIRLVFGEHHPELTLIQGKAA